MFPKSQRDDQPGESGNPIVSGAPVSFEVTYGRFQPPAIVVRMGEKSR